MESCDLRFYTVEESKAQEESLRQLSEEGSAKEEITRAPTGPNSDYTEKEFSGVTFFRFGFFDYAKLNVQNMLARYEAGKLYKIDLILDWVEQRVSIYINDEALKSESFFTQRKEKLESANALSIYGLSPGSQSKFSNIRVCNEICAAEVDKNFTTLSGATLGYSSAVSLFAGLSVLYFGLLA